MQFRNLQAAAVERKGGQGALDALMPRVRTKTELAELSDDLVLACMTKVVNRVQFSWEVVEKKWSQFEEAFLVFNVDALTGLSDEEWDAYAHDKRIVRSGPKIRATRSNAYFVADVAERYGSFGQFLAGWPSDDQIGLMAHLKKCGGRLGGQTGQWVLRMVGWDAFVLTPDVVSALKYAGCDIAENPSSKRDLAAIQSAFNAWHEQSGLPYAHISRTVACAVGEDLDNEHIIDQAKRFFETN
ncbi:MAG: DNA-3-methyladenine glycosylase I [Erythrobacter sp.]|uniref:DNA-3-methyladenine glycosylase I n=1 Tax=Erythrobacter sp. TaxID=1042 RepID=UPI0026281F3B|nr:DNA-3-methyladenine glycosylase I [Erythrobacter sp.]MDJ0977164.1 DNA-3-methyladenine glycosylase I [Erythrobacter sp.]